MIQSIFPNLVHIDFAQGLAGTLWLPLTVLPRLFEGDDDETQSLSYIVQ
jgi:hypothetical protein